MSKHEIESADVRSRHRRGLARRQARIYIAGLATTTDTPLPGPGPTRARVRLDHPSEETLSISAQRLILDGDPNADSIPDRHGCLSQAWPTQRAEATFAAHPTQAAPRGPIEQSALER